MLFAVCFQFGKSIYAKQLAKKYLHIRFSLHTRQGREAFQKEDKILRDISHTNVIRLHNSFSTWIPFVSRVGHLFVEKVDISVLDAHSRGVFDQATFNIIDISHQILSVINYLHSRSKPIYHCNLSIETVFLKLDSIAQKWIVKIGNFNQAQIVSSDSVTEETGLLQATGTEVRQRDLSATAKMIHFLFTGRNCSTNISLDDLLDIPSIEMSSLILALEKGLTTAEGLLTPAFQSVEYKISILSELNALFKGAKNNKAMKWIFSEAETRAYLVIGGLGAWNKNIDKTVMEEYGLGRNIHNITTYVDLLRMIRNILQHGHENPASMLAICGKPKPSVQEILLYFLSLFPFFYPHSFLCFFKFFDKERTEQLPGRYLSAYEQLEQAVCNHKSQLGMLAPLQSESQVTIKYASLDGCTEQHVHFEKLHSSIPFTDVSREIIQMVNDADEGVCIRSLIVKCNGKVILNPFQEDVSDNEDSVTSLKTNLCIPEGSTLEVMKPEIKIEFANHSHPSFRMEIKQTHNLKAVKGILRKMHGDSCDQNWSVSLARKLLPDKQNLAELDFIKYVFIVATTQKELQNR